MKPADPRDPSTKNFSYQVGDTLAPAGEMSRLRSNLRAIQLLRFLERERRNATPEEKKILSGYSGWGALSEALNAINGESMLEKVRYYVPPAQARWEEKWGMIYREVKATLTPEEMQAATASVLNAHFTSPEVVGGMWDMVKHLGFTGGQILEPAGGGGGFVGLMPSEIGEASNVTLVEIDPLSARIAAKLYPQIKVRESGFEKAPIGPGSVALAIGNVPFEQTGPVDKSLPMAFNLHNYFFAKSVEKLAAGGVMLYITSAYTMDASAGPQRLQRQWIAERTELLGAMRLPNTAFKASSGTEVVTDILILRKPNGPKVAQEEAWGRTVDVDMGGGNKRTVNEYYARHPEMVIGREAFAHGQYGMEYTVHPHEGISLGDALAGAIARLPAGVLSSDLITTLDPSERIEAEPGSKEFQFVERDGGIWQVNMGALEQKTTWSPAQLQIAKEFLALRDAYNSLLASELRGDTPDLLTHKRIELNSLYDAFTSKNGFINAPTTKIRHLSEDPEFGRVLALEKIIKVKDAQGVVVENDYEKSDCFTKETVAAITEPTTASSVDDAVTISLSWRLRIDTDFIASLVGHTGPKELLEQQIIATGRVFRDPEAGCLVPAEGYLSGNVRKALAKAVAANESDPDGGWRRNVEALEAVQPEWVPAENIPTNIGATWIPAEIMQTFGRETLDLPYLSVHYNESLDAWTVQGKGGKTAENSSTYGTERMNGDEILEALLNMQTLRITDPVRSGTGNSTTEVYNPVQSELVKQKAEALQGAFRAYVMGTPEVRDELEKHYNEKKNCFCDPKYDGTHMALPGLSPEVQRKDNQLAAVWRMLQERRGIGALGVGFGKTYSQIMVAQESRRLGLCRKPLIVVANATLGQYEASYRKAYPLANLLVADETKFSAQNRKRFCASAATGDWDCVIMAESHYSRLKPSPALVRQHLDDQLTHLEMALLEAKEKGDRMSTKIAERKKREVARRVDKMDADAGEHQDDAVYFEELGFDFVQIDECHAFKSVWFPTKMERVKGFSVNTSERAFSNLLKVRHIQEKNGQGRGAIGWSGTPVTNQLAEAWVQTYVFAPEVLKENGMRTFDQFASQHCIKVTALELNEATNRFKIETRLSKFVGGVELLRMLRSCWEVQMDHAEAGLKIPGLKGGGVQNVVIPLSPANAEINEMMRRIYAAYERSTNKRELSYVPIMLMQVGMAAAIDPQLIMPEWGDDRKSPQLVDAAADSIFETWQAGMEGKTAQLVFCDRYNPMDISKLTCLLSGQRVEVEYEEGGGEDEDAEVVSTKAGRGGFTNLYEKLKGRLMEKGIPAGDIAIVTDFKTDKARTALWDRVNAGEVRITIGSTHKLGVGVNVQKRLVKITELDVPRTLTPADVTQRRGRLLRQGNTNEEVEIQALAMAKTAGAGLNGRVARKATFLAQLLMGTADCRDFDDPASSLSFSSAEMSAMIVGDERVIRQVELTEEIRQMKVLREGFFAERASTDRQAKSSAKDGEYFEERQIANDRQSILCEEKFGDGKFSLRTNFSISGGEGNTFTDRKLLVAELDSIAKRLMELPGYQDYKSARTRFELNGVQVTMARHHANYDGTKFDLFCGLMDPLSSEGKVMRDIEFRGGEGFLRACGNSSEVLSRESARNAEKAAAAVDRAAKLTERLAAMPTVWPKLAELAEKEAELSKINVALLEEATPKRQEATPSEQAQPPETEEIAPVPEQTPMEQAEAFLEQSVRRLAGLADRADWRTATNVRQRKMGSGLGNGVGVRISVGNASVEFAPNRIGGPRVVVNEEDERDGWEERVFLEDGGVEVARYAGDGNLIDEQTEDMTDRVSVRI